MTSPSRDPQPPADSSPHGETPELSVVIPAHNEAGLLETSIQGVVEALRAEGLRFEIIIAENGSKDATARLAEALASAHREVRALSYPAPNYGAALREGIYRARGTFVACDEVDLCDMSFHLRALGFLRRGEADLVVGSKAMPGARDLRPRSRRVATKAYNLLLRATVGFRGTDTHGLKTFARRPVLPVVAACVSEFDVFASELVIRTERAGLRVLEIPVSIEEKRPPSIDLTRRVPRVLKNLGRLMIALRSAEPGAAPPPTDPSDDPQASDP